MAHDEKTADEDIGRPGPGGEGRYQQRGQPPDQSVLPPPRGTVPNADPPPTSTPVTRKDYEFPGEEARIDKDGSLEPPGGDAG